MFPLLFLYLVPVLQLRYYMALRVSFIGLFLALLTMAFSQETLSFTPEMLPDDTSKVRILNDLSIKNIYSDPAKAMLYLENAMTIARNIDDYKGLANTYINYGKALSGVDNKIKAAEYYFNALYIGEESEDDRIIATAKNYIATVYISIQDYNIAGEYLLDAIELNRKNGEENLLAANYNNIGMVYRGQGENTIALEYFFMSLEMNQKLGNTDWISNNYGNIGATYSEMNNPKAVDYFNKRIDLKTELGDVTGAASGYVMLGNYYINKQQWEMSLEPLLKALDIAMQAKSWEMAADCKNMLSQAYSNLGRCKDAFTTHVEYTALVDSSQKQELSKIITRLELQHQFEKQQQLEDQLQEERRMRNYILGSALLAALIILLLLIRNQREKIKRAHLQKQLLEEELDHKNRELTTNMLYLLRKNELIECISDKLIGLRKNLKKENQQVIQQVITDLRGNLDKNVWEEFEIRFNDVHGSFYQNLQKDFPDLTSGDKRLCAFLRMDMTTKEISAITGQSISSIEVARTRLRKKLGISNTQIGLSQFLSNY